MEDIEELGRAHRFDQLGVDARYRDLRLAGRGQKNNDQVSQPLVGADLGGHRASVHARHHHVDDRHVEAVVASRGTPHIVQGVAPALKAPLAHAP